MSSAGVELAAKDGPQKPPPRAASAGPAMIEVQELRKFYGSFEALKGISFTVGRGEIVGLLGPNGAGKTTTMKILTGYISATSGWFGVAGFDGFKDSLSVRKNIGYLPENAPLYPDMGIVEYLKFVCEVRRIPRRERKERIDKMIQLVGLTPMVRKNIGELSKGFRQRVGLAQAMIHEPPVLILDEPTSGLDPNQIVEIRKLIKDLGENRTIILSTHNLPEVRMTCSRMIIISNGRKVADGSAEELERDGREATRLQLTVKLGSAAEAEVVAAQLGQIDKVANVTQLGQAGSNQWQFAVDSMGNADLRPAVYDVVKGEGWGLLELRTDVMDLEKIFHKLTQY
ncbi:MAG: ABC-2 type transport system ATP-binding protein [Myxococcota bacterium]|jgi:ABC-2 type transport system ATP-binding protein